MINDLSLGLPWIIVSILPFALGFIFCVSYFKTKDEIKLMFASAYLIASTSFITHINPLFETSWLFETLHEWGALPIISAILLTSLSFIKKFNKKIIFNAYITSLCFTVLLMITPITINEGVIFQLMTLIIIPSSAILLLKNKNILGLMFILSISCFAIGGVAVSQHLDTLFISTCYIFGFIFTGFVLNAQKK